jgi:peroxiredoxin
VLGALSFGTLVFGYLSWRLPGAERPEHPRSEQAQQPLSQLTLGLEAATASASVGKPLPDLVLVDQEGRALTFGALRGRPAWLVFFRGAYCAYCREQLRGLGAQAAAVAQAGVQLLAVAPDPPALLARLRSELALPFPLLSDQGEQAVTALCGGVAHCQLLVDPAGIVRWAAQSESWSQAPAPQALLEAARQLEP